MSYLSYQTIGLMSDTSPPLPVTQKAIIQGNGGEIVISENVALPQLEPDQVLVKTVAVALNPTDHKTHSNFPSPGAIMGCDFAGRVVAVGTKVVNLRIGDQVCGAVHGSNLIDHETGAFAEYVRATGNFVLKIPAYMSFEKAAALGGIGYMTVGRVLWGSFDLPGTPENPTKKPIYILVYGGSTSTGTMAIQLLRLFVSSLLRS